MIEAGDRLVQIGGGGPGRRAYEYLKDAQEIKQGPAGSMLVMWSGLSPTTAAVHILTEHVDPPVIDISVGPATEFGPGGFRGDPTVKRVAKRVDPVLRLIEPASASLRAQQLAEDDLMLMILVSAVQAGVLEN